MMNQLVSHDQFRVVCEGEDLPEISGIYCGDLLSMVMGRAQENHLWITVMGNINAVAVAVLCDMPVMVLAEGCQLDDAALARAKTEGLWVLSTTLPTFEAGQIVASFL